ncbi:hypothetical protein RSal33209_2603 [Renibacterium salmoninarum ATCC 33209]|uniref:Uncharacterized protein n=1 Tax=Renibacterium salmoninarum (strain ATCC 33209 / DSM 20767 / JCM 11484 / NBRC 15589 / NCIMB 2235) TaxID=288705 RepID=A9WRP6_RENSM|nr:hypothetical protein RSal33209_2603 [Renibacterium salmoninarum ATCC 33209]
MIFLAITGLLMFIAKHALIAGIGVVLALGFFACMAWLVVQGLAAVVTLTILSVRKTNRQARRRLQMSI